MFILLGLLALVGGEIQLYTLPNSAYVYTSNQIDISAFYSPGNFEFYWVVNHKRITLNSSPIDLYDLNQYQQVIIEDNTRLINTNITIGQNLLRKMNPITVSCYVSYPVIELSCREIIVFNETISKPIKESLSYKDILLFILSVLMGLFIIIC